jgi:hypothetical protein
MKDQKDDGDPVFVFDGGKTPGERFEMSEQLKSQIYGGRTRGALPILRDVCIGAAIVIALFLLYDYREVRQAAARGNAAFNYIQDAIKKQEAAGQPQSKATPIPTSPTPTTTATAAPSK